MHISFKNQTGYLSIKIQIVNLKRAFRVYLNIIKRHFESSEKVPVHMVFVKYKIQVFGLSLKTKFAEFLFF